MTISKQYARLTRRALMSNIEVLVEPNLHCNGIQLPATSHSRIIVKVKEFSELSDQYWFLVHELLHAVQEYMTYHRETGEELWKSGATPVSSEVLVQPLGLSIDQDVLESIDSKYKELYYSIYEEMGLSKADADRSWKREQEAYATWHCAELEDKLHSWLKGNREVFASV